jgi:HEAT repeat protein
VGRKPFSASPSADQQATVTRLQQQVESLQARLRAREEVVASARAARSPADRIGAMSGANDSASGATTARADQPAGGAAADPTRSAKVQTSPSVQAALDRFYKYLEATAAGAGRERWREARELIQELKAMGAPAGQALMQVLAAGTDTDERRAAARLLGQLQVANAVPLLRDVIERDDDLLLRRAAASGLRQIQSPDSIPVLERLLNQPSEDRFVRLSAAVGLAEFGKPHGVTGLVHIFEESTADGRGREMAFRALSSLKDDRPLPFMRQLANSQAEPGYRLQAIRYLSSHGDQQALASLHVLMNSPSEQPSIRDAAAQAHAVISGRK